MGKARKASLREKLFEEELERLLTDKAEIEAVEAIRRKYPGLNSPSLLEKFPLIAEVAETLGESADVHTRITGRFQPFKELKVRDLGAYLDVLSQHDSLARYTKQYQEAVKLYEDVIRLFGLRYCQTQKQTKEPELSHPPTIPDLEPSFPEYAALATA